MCSKTRLTSASWSAQELMVDEMVAAVDAMSREALGEALRLTLASSAAVTALRSVEALGPLRGMLFPMPLPLNFLATMNNRIALTAEDHQALDTLALVLDVMGGSEPKSDHRRPAAGLDISAMLNSIDSTWRTGTTVVRGAGELAPIMPELLPGMQHTAEMFIAQLIRRMALRLADDLAPSTRS
jgi:aarF domain-containing kinase